MHECEWRTLCLRVSSADNLCKQFGPWSGPTKCRAWSRSKLFDTLIVLLKFFLKKWFRWGRTDMCLCFVWFESLCPSQQFFSYVGTGLPGLNQYSARINVSYSRTQCSIADETQTGNPSVSSQALYHWATGDQRSYWIIAIYIIYT